MIGLTCESSGVSDACHHCSSPTDPCLPLPSSNVTTYTYTSPAMPLPPFHLLLLLILPHHSQSLIHPNLPLSNLYCSSPLLSAHVPHYAQHGS